MDPKTVLTLLAFNLVFAGLFLFLIGHRHRVGNGREHMSAGSFLIGLAYLGRLFVANADSNPVALVLDVAMVLGALLFLSGVRQLLLQPGLPRLGLVGLALGYAAAQVVTLTFWGLQGRFIVLNFALSSVYASVAVSVIKWHRLQIKSLHFPYRMLAAVIAGMSVITSVRGYNVAVFGVVSMTEGLAAQVFHAYSGIAVVSMAVILLWIVFEEMNHRLLEMTTRDPLTGLLNRRGLDAALAQHFANRNALSLTVLAVDIDHFKRVNDQHGHAMGDRVLRAVAFALSANVRGNDFVARVGGEEFLVGCVGDDLKTAEHLGERLRTCMTHLPEPVAQPEASKKLGKSSVQGKLPGCTVSVGISNPFTQLDGCERATREADAALYAAKAAGRNCVVIFDATQHAASEPASIHVTQPGALLSAPSPLAPMSS